MRPRAWLGSWLSLALTFASMSCSGGYPLPPTRCDDWCNATQGMGCEADYDPASCVAACERTPFAVGSQVEDCAAPFDAAVACLRAAPRNVSGDCEHLDPSSCYTEQLRLGLCLGTSQ